LDSRTISHYRIVKKLGAGWVKSIFSFGVVLYEMVTGRQPFASESAAITGFSANSARAGWAKSIAPAMTDSGIIVTLSETH
jgi:serine/threonine protein kinase